MIELREISKTFGEQELFSQASFMVGSNEKIGLVGRNGYGKTTLFNLINQTLQPDSGSIVIPKNYRIGCLEQIISFSRQSVLEEVCLGLPEEDCDASWKAEKVLHGLGFSIPDMRRSPNDFSGGFQVRINLAKILVSGSNMLLLDEPNNYLDIVAIRWLIRFLQDWQGELMLITHDRSFMDTVVSHIVGIHRRRVRKIKGTTQRYYQQIEQEEQIYEKTRKRDESKRRKTEIFISKFRAKARQAGLAQSRLKTLSKLDIKEKLEQLETFDFSFTAAPFGAPQMMSVENLGFSYEQNSPLLFEGLTFNAGRKERLCVVGKNGKGKSTLLKVLAGELPPVNGRIKLHPKLAIGYYAQSHAAELGGERSVLDEIMSADPSGLPQRARSICGSLLFSQDLALKPISVLSGGEKSRVLLGKILMQPAHLLLLDEPTNHLDLESTQTLCEAIDEFDGSVIMVTHNELILERIAERLLVFDENKARYYEGGYRDFLEQVGWQDESVSLKAPTEGKPKTNLVHDRKARKRELAQLRQERSQALKPLEEQIEKLEKKISDLEAESRRINEELVAAAYKSDSAAIAELSRQSKKMPAQIETLYTELDKVFQEYEALRGEFEHRLQEREE
ncbi:MAG: ATP-binding cassette domain-containing protein [Candidatus Omnitrophota bacterium]